MGDLRATETWYGRPVDPTVEYADSAAAPVKYVQYPYTYPPMAAAPPPADGPRGLPPPVRDPYDPYAAQLGRPVAPQELPSYEIPPGMIVPGVQHPDGRFEPHPAFVRALPPRARAPPPEESPKEEKSEEPTKHVTELAVPVCCEACKERIVNYVGEVDGVDEVECDVNEQKVKVTSEIPPADVLQLCKKCFKRSFIL